MVPQSRGNRLSIEAWETESLRFTAFPIPASPIEDVSWWQSLVGQPPEVEVTRPREGGIRAEGAFEAGRLILETLPFRIDLRLIPSPELSAAASGFATIGKFTEILAPFAQVTNRWLSLDSCPEIQRIAFGAVLFASVDSKESGYRQLAAYLPGVDIDPEHSIDFLYQINRPRESTTEISNLTINRLTKWSVALIFGGDFFVEPTQISYHETPQKHIACRLELDISTTVGGREPLPRDRIPSILSEFMDVAKEIVIEGDIP
jgi:hypothetical protein